MGCGDVQRIAYFYLDGTVGTHRRDAIRSHLDACPPCRERILFHERIRQFVKARLSRGCAPETLRVRIVAELRALPSPSENS